jgi:ABC-2 type transport system permease protein
LFLPLSFFPAALAYLARFAFDSEMAFFAVLAFEAVAALVVYRIALESAVGFAEGEKETIVASLSSGTGPIAG